MKIASELNLQKSSMETVEPGSILPLTFAFLFLYFIPLLQSFKNSIKFEKFAPRSLTSKRFFQKKRGKVEK